MAAADEDGQQGDPLVYIIEELTEATEHEIAEAVVTQLTDDGLCFTVRRQGFGV